MHSGEIDVRQQLYQSARECLRNSSFRGQWVSFSQRQGKDQFLITPLAEKLNQLSSESLCLIELERLGALPKGSLQIEGAVHASIYQVYPETQCVIHSRQMSLSFLAARGRGLEISDPRRKTLLGGYIPCAAYKPSGSRKQKAAVLKVLARASVKGLILANEGALFWGSSIYEALEAAKALEEEASLSLEKWRAKASEGYISDGPSREKYFLYHLSEGGKH